MGLLKAAATLLLAAQLAHAFHVPSAARHGRLARRAPVPQSLDPASRQISLAAAASLSEPAAATRASDAESGKAAARAKSALILGWFGASSRELELVERVYKRNGYEDVTVMPSLIAALTKPSGWFRTFKQVRLAEAPRGAWRARAL